MARGGAKTPAASQVPTYIHIDLRDKERGHHLIPSAMLWSEGKFLSDLKPDAFKAIQAGLRWTTWVVPAKNMPGEYDFRLYTLPKDEASTQTPDHPDVWLKQKSGSTYGTGYGTGYGSGTAAKTSYNQPSSLPLGIRFRCPGCGHWWKESTLAPHSTHCCPGREHDQGDWAIMCECCDTLDQVSTIKPGFPRKPKGVKQEPEVKEPVEEQGAAA